MKTTLAFAALPGAGLISAGCSVHVELTVRHTLNKEGDLLFGYEGSLNVEKSQFPKGVEVLDSFIRHACVIERYKLQFAHVMKLLKAIVAYFIFTKIQEF